MKKILSRLAAGEKLAESEALRAAMGAAARKRAEEMSWTRVARQYEGLYEELLSQPPPPRCSLPPKPLPELRLRAAMTPPAPQREVRAKDTRAVPHLAAWSVELRRQGLSHEAEMVEDALSAALPEHPDTHATRAAAAEAAWRWHDAVAHWDAFLGTCPDARRSTGLARKAICQARAGAFPAARRTLSSGAGGFDILLCAAEIATSFGTAADAAAAWHRCTSQYPDRIEGFLGLARQDLRLAKFAEADALLEHVRQIWPESAEAAALWARAADDRGDFALAEGRWRHVFAAHARREAILIAAARHFGLMADRASCEALCAGIDIDENVHSEVMLQFHVAGWAWDLAVDECRRLVQRRPAEVTQRLLHAELLMRRGTQEALQEALEALLMLRRLSPASIEIMPPLAHALIATGADEEAKVLIDAIPEERSDRQAELLRVWCRLMSAREQEGLGYWRAVFLAFGFASPLAEP